MKYRCFIAFTSVSMRRYVVGSEISSSEYNRLDANERVNFKHVPIGDLNPYQMNNNIRATDDVNKRYREPYGMNVNPITQIPDSVFESLPTIDKIPWVDPNTPADPPPSSETDFGGFGGGDSGGGGVSGDW